ncbi:dioxygenase [Nocardioidaceae bacterium]|nr:dioxygenase [Nocardioidaceae bacterium]
MNPAVPAGAYADLVAERRTLTAAHRAWTPADGPTPSLYLAHGAPPLLDDPVWLRQLHDWSLSMPKPRGVVVVSAHWENAPLAVAATDAAAPLFYDFGGFHPAYYRLRYPSPDSSDLARRVVGALPQGTEVHQHVARGLDHGAFIPMMAMYPAADVPVLQVSMPSLRPEELLALGRRLRSLRAEGYLVVGSGFLTHWMGGFATGAPLDVLPAFNAEFDAWAAAGLDAGDVDALADFRRAPGVAYAHRTVEHYVPLFVALGAADDAGAPARTVIEGTQLTNSKRSVQLT